MRWNTETQRVEDVQPIEVLEPPSRGETLVEYRVRFVEPPFNDGSEETFYDLSGGAISLQGLLEHHYKAGNRRLRITVEVLEPFPEPPQATAATAWVPAPYVPVARPTGPEINVGGRMSVR